MPTTLSCTTNRSSGTISLIATGEIDLSNIETFTYAMKEATSTATQENRSLMVDLIGIDYLDSGAISTLFAYADQIRIVTNPILIPVLTISGLTHVVNVETPSDGALP